MSESIQNGEKDNLAHESEAVSYKNDDSLQDSREKLEADVSSFNPLRGLRELAHTSKHHTDAEWKKNLLRLANNADDYIYRFITESLDRQAAITEREYFETKCRDCQDAHDRQTYKNIERYAELKEKVGELRASEEINNKLIAQLLDSDMEKNRRIVEYAEKVDELEAENARLREKLSQALDHAHAIEKLRESLKDCTSKAGEEPYQFDTYWITANACDMLIDEIEREHEQRVAELKGAICERDGRIGSYERRNTNLNDALKVICKRFGVSTEWSAEDAARNVLEALESQYMELPTDADGVPIRVGDAITLPNGSRDKVRFITIREHDTVFNERGWVPSQCTHIEPRTVEDVLAELEGMRGDNATYEDVVARCSELACELRELLGSDAE